jgi:hypothetical protein
VIHQAAAPFAAQIGGRQARQQGRVLHRDLTLIIVAVQRPGLHLAAIQLAPVKQLMEGMQAVVTLRADTAQCLFQLVRRH